MVDFRAVLASERPLILDGGMGTMLQAGGLPPGEQPERFCLARPEVLKGIHTKYIKAGADIIITCTFGGTRLKLSPDLDPIAVNRQMARIARVAVDEADRVHPVFVAGDLGPCGQFVRPLGELHPLDLIKAYREQIRGLVEGGVDLLILETHFDLAEARLIVAAARAECELPILASMTFEQGTTLTGSSPEIFVETMLNMGVDAIGLNCGAGPEEMTPLVQRVLACSSVPVFVEPNAGLPELVDGKSVFRLPPEPFARHTARFVEMGARMVGGCCGTTPEHIAALRRIVRDLKTGTPEHTSDSGVVLTSRTALVRIGGEARKDGLVLIGERINPTGKKALQAAFQAGEFSLALQFAAEQIALGAPVLDVNVGAPMVDETALLPELVEQLTARYSEPLSLDSSYGKAIAAALPFCSGSSLVNSISGEAGRMEQLGLLCRQWGSPFILLPLQGKKLPVKASERISIIEFLLEKIETLRIPRRLVLVDALALAVASNADAAREGLETIRWCTAQGLSTTLGLSNISFGLPARELVNTTFFAMAAGAGLCSCIANPSSIRLREAKAASDVLMGYDQGAERFVAGYATWNPGNEANMETRTAAAPTLVLSLEDAVLSGERKVIVGLVEKELESGADPFALVRERLIPAIAEVGKRYERREYFLPQLLRSAETMQAAFAFLKPLLETKAAIEEQQVIVVATVEGDIHDIGKNIVSLMLGNHGFKVVDLGKDVKAETIVEAALAHRASLIGLSALMTTTMVRMQDTVKLVKTKGLSMDVMVGGAVVTPIFADRIGAHYSSDAVDAVRVAKQLLASRKAN